MKVIALLLIITSIIILTKLFFSKEEKKRKVDIDNSFQNWVDKYQQEKLTMPDLPHDKYLNVKDSKSKYTRMKNNSYYIDYFYNKDFNSQIYLRKLVSIFGEEDGKRYFKYGFELGLKKQDIVAVLGQPKYYKKEILKTKVKETLYYSSIKSENFYVFDDEILIKIVK